MSPKIIFYIRCLFHEDKVKCCAGVDNEVYFPMFKELYGISIFEYRKRVHDIQLENIKSISPFVIENRYASNESSPFGNVQTHTLQQLCELDDDAIVIPLDDDDWVSPEITEYKFDYDALNIWSTVSLRPYTTLLYHKNPVCEQIPFDIDLENTKNKAVLQQLLSNCYGIPAKYIKQLAQEKNMQMLSKVLQLHNRVRAAVREQPRFLHKENIQDEILSIYVKHLGNITSIMYWQQETKVSLKKNLLNDYKNYCLFNKRYINEIPGEIDWIKPYQTELINLNISCLTNFL